MIGNLLSDQPAQPKRTNSMVPPGMGELNYLQSLIAGITNQGLNTTASPTFVGLTLSGLTASVPIVTNASKALASVTYAAFKASLAIAQADVAGLTVASSPTHAGMTLSGLTASLPVVTDANKLLASVTYATFKNSLAITYSDVGAEASGAVATHAALITGVHGLVFTAGKTLTLQKSMTLTAADDTGVYTFPTGTKTLLATDGSPAAMVIASQATGDLLYASSATAWARLGIGAAGKALVVNGAGTLPEWGTVLTNPMDAAGQLIYGGDGGAPTKLAAGATTTILVGGGAAAPVWTTATGTGAPVRAGSPTFTTGALFDGGVDVAHGITDYGALTSSYLQFSKVSAADGGARVWGYSDAVGIPGLQFYGIIGVTDPTDTTAALHLIGGKKSGTAGVALGAAETVFKLSNWATDLITVLGGGKVGIGTAAPAEYLDVRGTGQFATSDFVFTTTGSTIRFDFGASSGNTFGRIQAGIAGGSAVGILALNSFGGNVGIGTTAPTSPLQVVGLTVYADETAAAAAGLNTGALYLELISGRRFVISKI